MRLRLFPKIWRHIPNAQATLRVAIVSVRTLKLSQRFSVLPMPSPVLLGHAHRIKFRVKVQRINQVTIHLRHLRFEDKRLPISGDGFVHFSHILQSVPQICVGLRIVGPKGDRLPTRRHGLVQLPLLPQSKTQIAISFRIVRTKGNRLPTSHHRLIQIP